MEIQNTLLRNHRLPVFREERIALVIQERLFCDCVAQLLRSPQRFIERSDTTIRQFEMRLETAPPPDLVISRVGSHDTTEYFNTVRSIRARFPKIRWIVLGSEVYADVPHAAAQAGVDGFLIEDAPVEMLRLLTSLSFLGHSSVEFGMAKLNVKRSVPNKIYQPRILPNCNLQNTFGAELWPLQPAHSPIDGYLHFDDTARLSHREHEILGFVANGCANKVIARTLNISEATVKAHVKALFRKMKVTSRTQAAIRASSYLNLQIN